jgi:hypothetical protein
VLAACGESAREETREQAPETSRDEPSGPRGQRAVRCEGASVDPPELVPVLSGAETDLEGTITAMEALVGANAGSATARVRLGELLLRTSPPRASLAQRFFARGLELHEQGCTLGREAEWTALQGAALSRMMQGDYAGAVPILRRSLGRWPDVRSTRYNLACALCREGDLDGCERELTAVLDAEGERQPAWLGAQERPPGHYASAAQQDPDLAALRAEPARFAAILSSAR